MPFDPTVKRTEGTVRAPDGKIIKITKGAKKNVVDLCANKVPLLLCLLPTLVSCARA